MSDVHSPICIDVTNIPTVKNTQMSSENCEKLLYKPSWKPESKTAYTNSFSENDIMQVAENILSQEISPNPTKQDIEKLVTDLTSVLLEPAKKVGLFKKQTKKQNPRKCPQKSWFNTECENMRKKFFKTKNDQRKAKPPAEKSS